MQKTTTSDTRFNAALVSPPPRPSLLSAVLNRCRVQPLVLLNGKEKGSPLDSDSPFMGQLPLKEGVYTINGIIHDFVIKNEKFLFLILGMCFEIIHNGPWMFRSFPNLL